MPDDASGVNDQNAYTAPDESPAEELGYGAAVPEGAPANQPFTGVSEELANERLETKRKTFFIDLKRNERGLFIKISERSGGRRSTVMIPYEYIEEFMGKIQTLRSAGPDPKTVQSE